MRRHDTVQERDAGVFLYLKSYLMHAFLTEKQELSCIVLGVPEYSNYMYQLVERKSLLA